MVDATLMMGVLGWGGQSPLGRTRMRSIKSPLNHNGFPCEGFSGYQGEGRSHRCSPKKHTAKQSKTQEFGLLLQIQTTKV